MFFDILYGLMSVAGVSIFILASKVTLQTDVSK